MFALIGVRKGTNWLLCLKTPQNLPWHLSDNGLRQRKTPAGRSCQQPSMETLGILAAATAQQLPVPQQLLFPPNSPHSHPTKWDSPTPPPSSSHSHPSSSRLSSPVYHTQHLQQQKQSILNLGETESYEWFLMESFPPVRLIPHGIIPSSPGRTCLTAAISLDAQTDTT